MTRAEAACGEAVRDRIGPALEAAVAGILGPGDRGWFEFLIDAQTHSPVLLFHYPSSLPAGFAYLKTFGGAGIRLAHRPAADRAPLGPAVAGRGTARGLPRLALRGGGAGGGAELLGEGDHPACGVPPAGREADADRFSRHYADLAALARHPTASRAVQPARSPRPRRRVEGAVLREYVGELRPGEARDVPPRPARRSEPAPRRDYQAMRDMYLSEPASFDEVLATLAELGKSHQFLTD